MTDPRRSVVSDYYEVLGVPRDATTEDIKRAYRKHARQMHPDVNPDGDVEEQFKEIGRAYDVLSNPEKRRAYDLGGDPGASGGGSAPGSASATSSRRSSARPPARGGPPRGSGAARTP